MKKKNSFIALLFLIIFTLLAVNCHGYFLANQDRNISFTGHLITNGVGYKGNLYLTLDVEKDTTRILEMSGDSKEIIGYTDISKYDYLSIDSLCGYDNKVLFSGYSREWLQDGVVKTYFVCGYQENGVCATITREYPGFISEIYTTICEESMYVAWEVNHITREVGIIRYDVLDGMSEKWTKIWNPQCSNYVLQNITCNSEYLYLAGKGPADVNDHPTAIITKISKTTRECASNTIKVSSAAYDELTCFVDKMHINDNGWLIVGISNNELMHLEDSQHILTKIIDPENLEVKKTILSKRYSDNSWVYLLDIESQDDDVYVLNFVLEFDVYLTLTNCYLDLFCIRYAADLPDNPEIKKRIKFANDLDLVNGCLINYTREDVNLASMSTNIDQQRLLMIKGSTDDDVNIDIDIFDYWIPRKVVKTISFDLGWSIKSLPVDEEHLESYFIDTSFQEYDCLDGYIYLYPDDPLIPGIGYWAYCQDLFGFETILKLGYEILYKEYGAHSYDCWTLDGYGTYPGWVYGKASGYPLTILGYDGGLYYIVYGGLTNPTEGYWMPEISEDYIFVVDQTED